MSSLLNIPLRIELTIYGYIREHSKQYNMMIPSDLNPIISTFYQRTYKLFGIGSDAAYQFGLKQQLKDENNQQYHVIKSLDQNHLQCS